MSIHNFKKYKESKVVLPHLDAILKVLSLTEQSLTYFQVYIPVARLLVVLKHEKAILEDYKKEYETINETKGLK